MSTACGDIVEIETRCRIPIRWTFGRIQWHVIPELPATLQGAATWRIQYHDSRATCHIAFAGCCYLANLSAILNIVFRHILQFFLFLMQFKLWRAAAFVSSPIHLFTSGTEHNEKNIKIHTRTLHSRISRSDIDIESHCRSKYTGVKKAHRNRSHCDFCQSTGWRGHACELPLAACFLLQLRPPSAVDNTRVYISHDGRFLFLFHGPLRLVQVYDVASG